MGLESTRLRRAKTNHTLPVSGSADGYYAYCCTQEALCFNPVEVEFVARPTEARGWRESMINLLRVMFLERALSHMC